MIKKVLIVEDEAPVSRQLELTLTKAGYRVIGIVDSVPEALKSIEYEQPDIVLVDIFLNGLLTGIDLGEKLSALNKAFIYLSASFQDDILEKARTTEPYGFLVKPFRDEELLVMIDVILYRHHSVNETRKRQEQFLEKSLSETINSNGNWKEKIVTMAREIQPIIPFDCMDIYLGGKSLFTKNNVMLMRLGFDRYKLIETNTLRELTGLDNEQIGLVVEKAVYEPGIFNEDTMEEQTNRCQLKKLLSKVFHLESCLQFPVVTSDGKIVYFIFYSRKADNYTTDHQKLLSLVHPYLARLAQNIIKLRVVMAKAGPLEETAGSRRTGPHLSAFSDIIGNSPAVLAIMDNITIAAPLDSSILILGESGTGKERIAKSIHALSPRKNNPLVIINCASLPANLIESELFGHEKGAFTGAIERRKGKFEVANKGTIFLDEIGEMPVEMQVRLLRVLQEREFERIGGNELMKIDVRIIAATNRDLEQEVKRGRFRLDLYYRLCVFPILVPSLKERGDDILLLAEHFIKRFATKFNRQVCGLSVAARKQLQNYNWPGNVRELENTIERAVMLSTGGELQNIPIFTGQIKRSMVVTDERPNTMDDTTREMIRSVLEKSQGKIGGKGGAAELLGIPATTLHSKMKKLGMRRKSW